MDEVEGWWITANVRRVPMSACRVEDRFFNLCGELCIMENEMKIHSQLDETKLKLDSSSLYNEVDPTGPRPAPSVSSRSHSNSNSSATVLYTGCPFVVYCLYHVQTERRYEYLTVVSSHTYRPAGHTIRRVRVLYS